MAKVWTCCMRGLEGTGPFTHTAYEKRHACRWAVQASRAASISERIVRCAPVTHILPFGMCVHMLGVIRVSCWCRAEEHLIESWI